MKSHRPGRLYVTAVVEFEVCRHKDGAPLHVKRDEEGKALYARLKEVAKYHAEACCREMERVLQQDSKQGRLFEPKSLLMPRKGI